MNATAASHNSDVISEIEIRCQLGRESILGLLY